MAKGYSKIKRKSNKNLYSKKKNTRSNKSRLTKLIKNMNKAKVSKLRNKLYIGGASSYLLNDTQLEQLSELVGDTIVNLKQLDKKRLSTLLIDELNKTSDRTNLEKLITIVKEYLPNSPYDAGSPADTELSRAIAAAEEKLKKTVTPLEDIYDQGGQSGLEMVTKRQEREAKAKAEAESVAAAPPPEFFAAGPGAGPARKANNEVYELVETPTPTPAGAPAPTRGRRTRRPRGPPVLGPEIFDKLIELIKELEEVIKELEVGEILGPQLIGIIEAFNERTNERKGKPDSEREQSVVMDDFSKTLKEIGGRLTENGFDTIIGHFSEKKFVIVKKEELEKSLLAKTGKPFKVLLTELFDAYKIAPPAGGASAAPVPAGGAPAPPAGAPPAGSEPSPEDLKGFIEKNLKIDITPNELDYLISKLYEKISGRAIVLTEGGQGEYVYNLIRNLKGATGDDIRKGVKLSDFITGVERITNEESIKRIVSSLFGLDSRGIGIDNLKEGFNTYLVNDPNEKLNEEFNQLIELYKRHRRLGLKDDEKVESFRRFKGIFAAFKDRLYDGRTDIPDNLFMPSGFTDEYLRNLDDLGSTDVYLLDEAAPKLIKRRVEHCYTMEIMYLKKHLEIYKILKLILKLTDYLYTLFKFFNLTANLTEYTADLDIGDEFTKIFKKIIISKNRRIELPYSLQEAIDFFNIKSQPEKLGVLEEYARVLNSNLGPTIERLADGIPATENVTVNVGTNQRVGPGPEHHEGVYKPKGMTGGSSTKVGGPTPATSATGPYLNVAPNPATGDATPGTATPGTATPATGPYLNVAPTAPGSGDTPTATPGTATPGTATPATSATGAGGTVSGVSNPSYGDPGAPGPAPTAATVGGVANLGYVSTAPIKGRSNPSYGMVDPILYLNKGKTPIVLDPEGKELLKSDSEGLGTLSEKFQRLDEEGLTINLFEDDIGLFREQMGRLSAVIENFKRNSDLVNNGIFYSKRFQITQSDLDNDDSLQQKLNYLNSATNRMSQNETDIYKSDEFEIETTDIDGDSFKLMCELVEYNHDGNWPESQDGSYYIGQHIYIDLPPEGGAMPIERIYFIVSDVKVYPGNKHEFVLDFDMSKLEKQPLDIREAIKNQEKDRVRDFKDNIVARMRMIPGLRFRVNIKYDEDEHIDELQTYINNCALLELLYVKKHMEFLNAYNLFMRLYHFFCIVFILFIQFIYFLKRATIFKPKSKKSKDARTKLLLRLSEIPIPNSFIQKLINATKVQSEADDTVKNYVESTKNKYNGRGGRRKLKLKGGKIRTKKQKRNRKQKHNTLKLKRALRGGAYATLIPGSNRTPQLQVTEDPYGELERSPVPPPEEQASSSSNTYNTVSGSSGRSNPNILPGLVPVDNSNNDTEPSGTPNPRNAAPDYVVGTPAGTPTGSAYKKLRALSGSTNPDETALPDVQSMVAAVEASKPDGTKHEMRSDQFPIKVLRKSKASGNRNEKLRKLRNARQAMAKERKSSKNGPLPPLPTVATAAPVAAPVPAPPPEPAPPVANASSEADNPNAAPVATPPPVDTAAPVTTAANAASAATTGLTRRQQPAEQRMRTGTKTPLAPAPSSLRPADPRPRNPPRTIAPIRDYLNVPGHPYYLNDESEYFDPKPIPSDIENEQDLFIKGLKYAKHKQEVLDETSLVIEGYPDDEFLFTNKIINPKPKTIEEFKYKATLEPLDLANGRRCNQTQEIEDIDFSNIYTFFMEGEEQNEVIGTVLNPNVRCLNIGTFGHTINGLRDSDYTDTLKELGNNFFIRFCYPRIPIIKDNIEYDFFVPVEKQRIELTPKVLSFVYKQPITDDSLENENIDGIVFEDMKYNIRDFLKEVSNSTKRKKMFIEIRKKINRLHEEESIIHNSINDRNIFVDLLGIPKFISFEMAIKNPPDSGFDIPNLDLLEPNIVYYPDSSDRYVEIRFVKVNTTLGKLGDLLRFYFYIIKEAKPVVIDDINEALIRELNKLGPEVTVDNLPNAQAENIIGILNELLDTELFLSPEETEAEEEDPGAASSNPDSSTERVDARETQRPEENRRDYLRRLKGRTTLTPTSTDADADADTGTDTGEITTV